MRKLIKYNILVPVSIISAVLIILGIGILIAFISYLVFHNLDKLAWLSYLIVVVYAYIYIKSIRIKMYNNFISFNKVLGYSITILNTTVIFYIIAYYMYLNYISPNQIEIAINKNYDYLVNTGVLKEITDYYKNQLRIQYHNPLLFIIGNGWVFFIVNAFIGMFMSALCYRELPETEFDVQM